MPEVERTNNGWDIYGKVALGNLGQWVFEAYGFLIERGEKISFATFAERIKRSYSLENPNNAAAYNWLIGWSNAAANMEVSK